MKTAQERANNEINKSVHEAFSAELQALLAKYKAEITIRETSNGYESYAEGLTIEFEGEYAEGEMIRPYSSMEMGGMLSGNCGFESTTVREHYVSI